MIEASIVMTVERNGEELEVEVEGNIYPGHKGVHTLPNGDPGYPDEPAEVEITDITLDGKVFDLTDEEMEKAHELLLRAVEKSEEEKYNDACDYEYDRRQDCDD